MFFTSDTHWWHTNIIRFQRHSFDSVEEMNEVLIQNWNSKIGPKDEVYHLGDVFFCGQDKALEILDRLNGRIHLVKGNHDKKMSRAVKDRFVWVKSDHIFKFRHKGERLWLHLYHYPCASWDGSYHGSWCLHGHTHGNYSNPDMKILDMGVDCWDYYPASLDDVIERMAKQGGGSKSSRGIY